jgi:hypothetical protein
VRYNGGAVTTKRLTNFMIDPELAAGLKRVKERDGISEGEQIRRGIRLWLAQKGITGKRPTAARASRRKA